MDATQLMRQAHMTAHDYMIQAVDDIDNKFGKGFAAKNPQLIAAYMNTAAVDFATTFGLMNISASLETIARALDK